MLFPEFQTLLKNLTLFCKGDVLTVSNLTLLPAEISELFDAWKAQFDILPAIDCPFTVSADGLLCINGVELCSASEIDYSVSCFDTEKIQLATKSRKVFTIVILLPDDKEAYVDWIYKTEQIYSAAA